MKAAKIEEPAHGMSIYIYMSPIVNTGGFPLTLCCTPVTIVYL